MGRSPTLFNDADLFLDWKQAVPLEGNVPQESICIVLILLFLFKSVVIFFSFSLFFYQGECNPDTCTQMTATEQWIFLCAAHKTPKEACTEDHFQFIDIC